MTEQISTHIDAALTCLEGITDPIERERAARHMVETLLPAATKKAKAVRQGVVLELRNGRTLREIGSMLDLTAARVDQIAKGK